MIMNYEEKYKEALERARQFSEHPLQEDSDSIVEYIFPELKESEDKQSKKWILEYLYDGLRKSDEQFKGQFKAAIAWLEKQGEQKPYGQRAECLDCQFNYAGECKGFCSIKKSEQKPAEWSEEDEEYLNFVIAAMKTLQVKCTENEIKHHSNSQAAPYYAKVINWLKSLMPQPKQKWSEEDEENFRDIIGAIHRVAYQTSEDEEARVNWLKSLKDRVQP